DLKIPHRSTDIDHAGDAAANVPREDIIQVRFDPRDFLLVRAHTVEIGTVWSRKQISRLKEVNVRVDVTGQNEFAHATDLAPERVGVLFAHRDPLNFVAVDHHSRIGQYLSVSGINHSGPDEGNFFSAQRCDA